MKVAPLGRLGSVVWFGAMPARDMIGGEAFVNRELPSRSDASNYESCGFPRCEDDQGLGARHVAGVTEICQPKDCRSNKLTRACPPEIVCHWRLRSLKQGLTRSDPEAIQAILASAPRNILYRLFCLELELLCPCSRAAQWCPVAYFLSYLAPPWYSRIC